MKFVALVSGGKDSIFSIMEAVARGHELVCTANLAPPPDQETGATPLETDSYMYQTAGHDAVLGLAECFQVPMVRGFVRGSALAQGLTYSATEGDEVEDMLLLLADCKRRFPGVDAVCSGAILSTYQRLRVEHVCGRLGLRSVGLLWQRDQAGLLGEMIEKGVDAVLVKVASIGLDPFRHLNQSLAVLQPHLTRTNQRYGMHVCGEGGEYETLVLDCPLFKRKLVLDETEVCVHSEGSQDPQVGVLAVRSWHTESKRELEPTPSPLSPPPPPHPLVLYVDEEATKAMLEGLAGLAAAAATAALAEDSSSLTSMYVAGDQVLLSGITFKGGGAASPTLTSTNTSTSTPTSTSKGSPKEEEEEEEEEARRQMLGVIDAMERTLTTSTGVRPATTLCSGGLSDVCFVHLYLADMSLFTAVNAAYCARFGRHLPPSRSCVAASLPRGVLVLADCWAVRGSYAAMTNAAAPSSPSCTNAVVTTPDFTATPSSFPAPSPTATTAVTAVAAATGVEHKPNRTVLHVQSLSRWAPLCIGPYSQANSILLGSSVASSRQPGLLLVAGQIGLVPDTMELRKPPTPTQLESSLPAPSSSPPYGGHPQNDECLEEYLEKRLEEEFFAEMDQAAWNCGQVLSASPLDASLKMACSPSSSTGDGDDDGDSSKGGGALMAVLYVNVGSLASAFFEEAALSNASRSEVERHEELKLVDELKLQLVCHRLCERVRERCVESCVVFGGGRKDTPLWTPEAVQATGGDGGGDGYGCGGGGGGSMFGFGGRDYGCDSDDDADSDSGDGDGGKSKDEGVKDADASRQRHCPFPLAVIGVKDLPKGAKVELEVVAMPSALRSILAARKEQGQPNASGSGGGLAVVQTSFHCISSPSSPPSSLPPASPLFSALLSTLTAPAWLPHPLPPLRPLPSSLSSPAEKLPPPPSSPLSSSSSPSPPLSSSSSSIFTVHLDATVLPRALCFGFVSVVSPSSSLAQGRFTANGNRLGRGGLFLEHSCDAVVAGVEALLMAPSSEKASSSTTSSSTNSATAITATTTTASSADLGWWSLAHLRIFYVPKQRKKQNNSMKSGSRHDSNATGSGGGDEKGEEKEEEAALISSAMLRALAKAVGKEPPPLSSPPLSVLPPSLLLPNHSCQAFSPAITVVPVESLPKQPKEKKNKSNPTAELSSKETTTEDINGGGAAATSTVPGFHVDDNESDQAEEEAPEYLLVCQVTAFDAPALDTVRWVLGGPPV